MKVGYGHSWYMKINKFLGDNECYLTTPEFDERLRKLMLVSIKPYTRIRVKTEYRKYGLLVSVGSHGNSVIVIKKVFSDFCNEAKINEDVLLRSGVIIKYTPTMFKECRHKKNVYNEMKKIENKKKRDENRRKWLESNLLTSQQKQSIRLHIWSDKILDNGETTITKYEELLYNKLYGIYKKRVRKQERIIIRNRVYFIDIYMRAYKAAIEIDGDYHNTPEQIEKDKQKDMDLSSIGLLVIRIKNEDVSKVFNILKHILEKRHKDILEGHEISTGTYTLSAKTHL